MIKIMVRENPTAATRIYLTRLGRIGIFNQKRRSMKKIVAWIFIVALVLSPQLIFAEDKGLHLGGMEKYTKKAKIGAKKATQQAEKDAEKAKKQARKEAAKAKKQAEKEKKRTTQEAAKKKKAIEKELNKQKEGTEGRSKR